MEDEIPISFAPLYRGTAGGADCPSCPFATNGEPTRPVFSEFPEDPAWMVIGEGPGFNEVRQSRPFIGAGGQVIDKVLVKIGRARRDLYVGNVMLCMPPQGTPEAARQRAAIACHPRLVRELAEFPGKPILTLGAVAARAIIPKPALDAIDPPDAPKSIRKSQKLRQQPQLKNAIARRKQIDKIGQRRLKKMITHLRGQIKAELKKKQRARPDEPYLQAEVARVQPRMELKAREDAIKEFELAVKTRDAKKKVDALKPKARKPKPIKISDIVSTLFEIDVDGTGPRPLIPGIHPASLLRGGGASIGGSHTPDLAYVNLIYDAGKVDALSKGKDIRLKLNVEYELTDVDRTVELFFKVYRDALEEDACSLDLETYVDDPDRHTALMAYVAKIRVVGLATQKHAISLAWDLLPSWCHSLLQLLIGRVEMTYHNGLYDRTVLLAQGFIMGPRWFDTLLAHHAAFPGNSHRLQTVTAQFYGVTPWKSEFRNAEENGEDLAIYNAKDTGGTHALRAPLTLWMKRTNTLRVYELDKKMSAIASDMHIAGMPVSREVNSELLATFTKNVVESRRAVEDTARDPKLREQIWHHLALQQARKQRKVDPDDFEARYNVRLSAMRLDPDWKWKIGASKHVAALLQAMGVGLYQTTEGGDVSTKKDVLEALTEVPIVREILTFRENDKLHSTFVWGLFDRTNHTGEIVQYGYADGNDRIHPIWNVHRISGRWASQWPVVSNVPKDKWKKVLDFALSVLRGRLDTSGIIPPAKGSFELDGSHYRFSDKDSSFSKMVRPNLRRQIRAPKGRVLVGFDFAQIEARVIALISGDPFLCAIFAEGRDPHIECARIIFAGFDTFDKATQKQLREQTKPIEYGAMYLAQVETLHKQMLKEGHLIKLVDLAKAIAKLLHAMAGLVRWQHQTVANASCPPYEVKDFVIGRRRTWPMGNVEGTEAVNFGVQTAAASIMNTGMAQMADRMHEFTQAHMIAQIHDACVFECWEDEAERLAEVIKVAYTQEYERDGRTIPFPVDVRIGQDWSEV